MRQIQISCSCGRKEWIYLKKFGWWNAYAKAKAYDLLNQIQSERCPHVKSN